ncbi:hypothetical protein ES703_37395 [subsurface metagenome]
MCLKMKVSILQPGYLPWLGFFEQLAKVDTFVLFNDVQYTKLDWRNRNRIKTPNGVRYLTVPIVRMSTETLIKDIKISYDHPWCMKHINMLRASYQKAAYFKQYFDHIKECIESKFEYLQDLNFALIKILSNLLGLEDKNFLWSSSVPYERSRNKSVNLLNICLSTGATYLYDGKSAQKFLDLDFLNEHGVTVEFQDYQHPQYPQQWGEFVPYLSVIDLLFNVGPESLDYIIGKKGRRQ